ncbi:hypothetical protein [Mycobacterium sp. IDR2000157661]|uniref:hypothetical protein n=1 Tax=Mycobacterium sp. IDR2000157661 TaxID=2867005 RepID=UPI001EEF32B7|nr:hypothetical protein [Mycobacterium sp. IDR2000157661]ULE34949.1 hypothetical protein K3G64_10460 [Mycobacterium sp. IDR2000157661]
MKIKQFKLVSAAVGAGALLGMGLSPVVWNGASSANAVPVAPQAPETKTIEMKSVEMKGPVVVGRPPITTAPYTIPTGEPQ